MAASRGDPFPLVPVVLVLVLAGGLYLWGLGARGFQDPDEGMYAEIAREMLESGDWVVPTFNGVPYLEKPPLVYWATAGAFRWFGLSECSARLARVVPILATIGVTAALAHRLLSARAAVLAAAALAAMLGSYLFSRLAQMDPTHLLGISLAALGVVQAGHTREASGRMPGWLFWLGTAVAVLSKGLPGLLFPIALLVGFALIGRNARALRCLAAGPALLTAGLLVIPWHALAAVRVPGFLSFYLWDNQVLRFLGRRAYAEDGTGVSTPVFLLISLFCFLPWLPYLGAAVVRPGLLEDRPRLFLLAWLTGVLAFFSVSAFKLEYYALPALPAVALLAAQAFDAAERDHGPARHGALRALRGWTLFGVAGGLTFTGATAWAWSTGGITVASVVRALALWSTNYRTVLDQGLPLPAVVPGFFAALLIGGGLVWTLGFLAVLTLLRRRDTGAAFVAVALVGVALCLLGAAVLRAVEPHHSVRPLAARIGEEWRPGDHVVHERGLEKGAALPFYLRRPVLVLNGIHGDLAFGSGLARAPFLTSAEFAALWAGGERLFVVTDLPLQRSALAALAPAPQLLAATPTRWLYSNR